MDVAQLNLHNFLGLQDCSGLVTKWQFKCRHIRRYFQRLFYSLVNTGTQMPLNHVCKFTQKTEVDFFYTLYTKHSQQKNPPPSYFLQEAKPKNQGASL